MTDLFPPDGDERTPDGDEREAARRVAAAHAEASREVEAFLRRAPDVPAPGDVAEYAALIAREEALRAERQSAAEAAGFSVPSVESP